MTLQSRTELKGIGVMVTIEASTMMTPDIRLALQVSYLLFSMIFIH
jgi:hypothetical protein